MVCIPTVCIPMVCIPMVYVYLWYMYTYGICIPMVYATVTDLANSCATPLFRRPQGSQGCLGKQNHPLSWNLVLWCAKIGPKTKKAKKTSELTKKMSKMMVF